MFVLDTDHMTVLQRGGAAALPLTLRLSRAPDADVVTTIISYEEQCKGWLAKTAREKKEALVRAYAQFGQHLEIYAGLEVLAYDASADALFHNLRGEQVRIGTQDLKIAAIVLVHSAVLLTRNARDFARVPGPKFEDWTT